jgi:hypothetical protein
VVVGGWGVGVWWLCLRCEPESLVTMELNVSTLAGTNGAVKAGTTRS